MFSLLNLVVVLAFSLGIQAAPVDIVSRQTACFLPGKVALPAEVSSGIPSLARAVTCKSGTSVSTVPNVSSGGIDFKSIDFQKSTKSPLGFALATFSTPADPATANLAKLQNQLNDYLAVEAGVRSLGASSSVLTPVKSVKFFLQFQIARVKTAQGQTLGVADTVAHQLGKVTKNAVGATASEIAQVNALAKSVVDELSKEFFLLLIPCAELRVWHLGWPFIPRSFILGRLIAARLGSIEVRILKRV